jgi:hypothetical protein
MSTADTPTVTVKDYVPDSACAVTKGLSKPISKQCATACANAGSMPVILADDGTIYWPIGTRRHRAGRTRSFCDKVVASGKVYERGGCKASVIKQIEAQAAKN